MSKINIMSLLLAGMFVAGLCCSQQVFAEDEEGGNNLSLPVIWSDGITKVLRGDPALPTIGGDVWDAYVWYVELIDDEENPVLVKEVCSPDAEISDSDCPSPLPDDAVEVPVYTQRDPCNTWQADSLWLDPCDPDKQPVDVDYVDWGDNLEAKNWYAGAIIRTETILHKDISAATMTGYEMIWLDGLGVDEVWGTTLNTYESDDATVYTGCARLTIQGLSVDPYTTIKVQVLDPNGDPVPVLGSNGEPKTDSDGNIIYEEYDARVNKTNDELGLTWDDDPYDPCELTGQQWVGDKIGDLYFQSVVWEATGSQDFAIYSAEINVKGKVIYGYNWDTGELSGDEEYYRITFSMDNSNPDIQLNAVFDTTQVMVKVEDDGGDETNNETGGGIAVIDYDSDLSYIDVELLKKKGGGGNKPSK